MESVHLINNLPLPAIIISQLLSLYNIRYKKILEKHKKFFSKNLNMKGLEKLKQLNKDINKILQFYNQPIISPELAINTNEINFEDTENSWNNVYYENKNYRGNDNSAEHQQVLKIRSENSKYMRAHPGRFTEYQRRFPSGTQLLNHSCGLYKNIASNKSNSRRR